MAAVSLDPWHSIVNVHWKQPTTDDFGAVVAVAGIPAHPPTPAMDYEGWQEPYRAELDYAYTGFIQFGPVHDTEIEASEVADALVAEHGPLAVYVLTTSDRSLPLSAWTVIQSHRGFLPYTVAWGRSVFGGANYACPPPNYLLHYGWTTQDHAQAYIEWSGANKENPAWNAEEYMKGSVSIIRTLWPTEAVDDPDPLTEGEILTCGDSRDYWP